MKIIIIINNDNNHANNEKQEMTHDRRNRTTKSRKNQNTWRKGNLHILGNIVSGHHQTRGDEIKTLERISHEIEKNTSNQNI